MQINTLSPGENLKKIRKSLNLKQYEITGGEITRNLISLIENNKTPLYDHTARLICKNINDIANKRNLEVYIDVNDILNPEYFEAKKTGEEHIAKLNYFIENKDTKSIKTEIINVEDFLRTWDMPKIKSNIYKIIGNYYYSLNKFHESYLYYIKSFENEIRLVNYNDLAMIICKIMNSCIRLGKYNIALNYSNTIDNLKNKVSINTYTRILYSKSLCYKYLSQYDDCIDIITELETIITNKELFKYIDVMTLKALCYKNKKMYGDALNIYIKLIALLNSNMIEQKLMILGNIIVIYRLLKFRTKVLEYLNIFTSLINNLNSTSIYLAQSKYELALTYEYLNDQELHEKYLIESLYDAKKIKDIDTIGRVINQLTSIFVTNKVITNFDVKNEILYLLKNNLLKSDNESIFQFMSYYNKTHMYEELDEIINLMLKISNIKSV